MSFVQAPRERMLPVLPLASMIDIMFLLLTFFLTAATFREAERQIDVAVPASETAPPATGSRTQIIVTVTSDGGVFIGDRRYEMDALRRALRELAQLYPNERVVVRGDQEARHGTIVAVMDAAFAAGLDSVSVSAVKPEAEAGR